MTPPDWNAVLTFIGGVIVTIIGATASRPLRKAQAKSSDREGEASLAHATMEWAKHLEETLSGQIAKLEADYAKRFSDMSDRMASLETENDVYRRHNGLLTGQLVEAGIAPAVMPAPRFRPSSRRGTDGET